MGGGGGAKKGVNARPSLMRSVNLILNHMS